MQEVKVVELLPNGLTRVELPKTSGDLGPFFLAICESVCRTPEELADMHGQLREKIPGLVERLMAAASAEASEATAALKHLSRPWNEREPPHCATCSCGCSVEPQVAVILDAPPETDPIPSASTD